MVKIIWYKLTTTTGGGAVLIATFSILSRVLGLIRDRLLASHFGAGSLLDSYYAAFKLPDLIFNTLVFGALSAAFIPIFTSLWIENKERALKLSNTVLNYLTVILTGLSILMFVFAPQVMKIIAPGFSPENLERTVSLSRIIIFSIIFFSISNVIGGVLNSLRKFFTFSLAPVFYNLGIIFGIMVLYPFSGFLGLAWGVLIGSCLHMLVQLPEAIKSGWRYNFSWKIESEAIKVFKLMVPRTFGLAASQLNQLVITIIGSTLVVGSITVFNLANNLQSFPASVFGISLAIAVFPIFSEALAKNNHPEFIKIFSLHFRRIIFMIVPVSVFILIERAQIVRIILGAANFDWEDTYLTAQTLGWFSVSLFAQSLIPMITRSFYALRDTRTPVIIGLFSIAINIACSLWLGQKMGVEGLALAFSICSIFNMLLLLFALRTRIGYLDDKTIISSTMRIIVNAIFGGLAVYLSLRFFAQIVNMRTFIGIFIQGASSGVIGLLVYFLLCLITSCPEITIIKTYIFKYLRPLFK